MSFEAGALWARHTWYNRNGWLSVFVEDAPHALGGGLLNSMCAYSPTNMHCGQPSPCWEGGLLPQVDVCSWAKHCMCEAGFRGVSKGREVQALFLRHEGYLGCAIGAFLKGAEQDSECSPAMVLARVWQCQKGEVSGGCEGCRVFAAPPSSGRNLSCDAEEPVETNSRGCHGISPQGPRGMVGFMQRLHTPDVGPPAPFGPLPPSLQLLRCGLACPLFEGHVKESQV